MKPLKKMKSISRFKSSLKLAPGGAILNPGNSIAARKVSFRNFKPVTDYSKCIKCARCWMYCPDIAYKPRSDGTFENIEFYCKGCGVCEKVCPVKCIKMEDAGL